MEIIFLRLGAINHEYYEYELIGSAAVRGYFWGSFMPFWLFTVATSVELSNMFAAIRALGAVMRVADSEGGFVAARVYLRLLLINCFNGRWFLLDIKVFIYVSFRHAELPKHFIFYEYRYLRIQAVINLILNISSFAKNELLLPIETI